jgi:hypothetical protein
MKKFSALVFFFIALLFSSVSMAQNSNPWVGVWELKFKNVSDDETNFDAVLTIEHRNSGLEGKILYYYQDGTEEEVGIEHFNESDSELIHGFKQEDSDDLFFPLTLRYEGWKTLGGSEAETISGSWEEEQEESYNVIGKKYLLSTEYSDGQMAQSMDQFVGNWELTLTEDPSLTSSTMLRDPSTPLKVFSATLTIESIDSDGSLRGKLVNKLTGEEFSADGYSTHDEGTRAAFSPFGSNFPDFWITFQLVNDQTIGGTWDELGFGDVYTLTGQKND